MQSGITASAELRAAFQSLISGPSSSSTRGILVTISSAPESLVPGPTIPGGASFTADLANIEPLISETAAAYILLKDDKEPGKVIGVTYVPDKAPVRQKMLFASTRLTLVRELGTEHFSSTLFATLPAELTPTGWAKHEAHGSLSAPLTDEERSLAGIKEAEAQESRGTGTRQALNAKGLSLPMDADAEAALQKLAAGKLALVQLGIDIPRETLVLAASTATATPASLGTDISADSPRYSIYSHAAASSSAAGAESFLFIYTCPTTSSIKERMLYATSRSTTFAVALPKVGLTITKRLEATSPQEITEDVVLEELGLKQQAQGQAESAAPSSRGGFARPKRPGKR